MFNQFGIDPVGSLVPAPSAQDRISQDRIAQDRIAQSTDESTDFRFDKFLALPIPLAGQFSRQQIHAVFEIFGSKTIP